MTHADKYRQLIVDAFEHAAAHEVRAVELRTLRDGRTWAITTDADAGAYWYALQDVTPAA